MERTNDNLLKKTFKSYLVVNILIVLAGTLGVLVDGIVIGQVLDQSSVSAYGLSGSIITLIAAIAGIFSTGSGARIANHIGKGNDKSIRKNFTVTVFASLVVAVIITVVMFFGSEAIAKLLGAGDELLALTTAYIKGLSLGMIPNILTQSFMRYNRLDNHSTLSFVSLMTMTAINIVLDVVLTAVFDMGLWGMGLATSISYWVSAIICGTHFVRRDSLFKLTSLKGTGRELASVIAIGSTSALNRACVTVRTIILNWLLIILAGSIGVSALSVQSTVNQFLMGITMGMGMTTMDMAGIFFGEKNESALRKTLRVSIKTGLKISIVVAIVLIIFADPVVRVFLTADEQATALAVHSLRWFCASVPFSLICVTLLYFYQSTKNLFMANVIAVGHGLAFVVLISLAGSAFIGAEAVWISFLFAEVLTILTVLAVIRVKTGAWPKSLADLVFLPAGFTPDPDRVLDLTIDNDMDMVMELSSRISEFCSRHTDECDKVTKLSLCIEEMAGNIVRHGFKDDKKHFIDIRIVVDEDDIIFRIRDDGVKFNPIEYGNTVSETADIMGIRIIRDISKDMNYKYAVNMNNLTIVL